MRKCFTLIAVFTIYFTNAQFNPNAPWMKKLKSEKQFEKESEITFKEIVSAFDNYWENRDPTIKGSGYKPFKRWENFWKDCLNDDGTLVNYKQLKEALENRKSSNQTFADDSNWIALGPTDFLDRSFSNANIGRLNAIAVDPNDPETYFAGSPAGGIWKSENSGETWMPLSDELPQIGVSAIALDPLDSNTIYIGTGDDDAGDTYSIGLLKSIDGGQTWNTTGLTFTGTSSNISEVYIDRSNGNNKIFVSSSAGFYKSTDGGVSFTRTLNANLNDAKLKPGDSNVIYAVSDSKVYKSTNNGDSFLTITNGLPVSSTRLVIDVTPADSDYVYVLSAGAGSSFQGLYKSTDSGNSFTRTQNVVDIFESNQAWYDLAIAVSDIDADEVYTGVLNVWKSGDGGDTFQKLNNWAVRNASYTHADIHFLRFFDGELYCGSDGGFYKSVDGGNTFLDLTEGMQISQFYKIAVSKQNSKKMAGGTQDNGSFGLTANGEWNVYGGGDGMDAAIDPNNEDNYYGFMQFGQNLWVSTNAGVSQTYSVSEPIGASGNWITPIDINKESEVFAAYNALYRLDGRAFTKISPNFAGAIDELEIDPNNSDIMFVSIGANLFKSTNRGVNFESVSNFSNSITAIEVHNNNSDIVYVTTSGSSGKVLRSADGGETFLDITGNLPNIPKLEIEHQGRHSDDPLFIGTSIGVYRIDNTLSEWEVFNNNLPNSPITDLEINLEDGNITAATYGRGIWQSIIPTKAAQSDVRLVSIELPRGEINCDNFEPSITIMNNGIDPITSVNIESDFNGVLSTITWEGNILTNESANIMLPQTELDFGSNTFKVTTTINNDAYEDNNSKSINILKNRGAQPIVYSFEDEETELLTEGDLWERGMPSGSLLNQASSGRNVYATNLDGNYTDNTRAYLTSGCYDLTTVVNPILKFQMAFDIEEDWDFINVEYSLNSGETWQILGFATDANWYNSDRLPDGNDCFNCPGAQWTGVNTTLTEYSYDLSEFNAETNFVFRFNFVSDPGVNNEGVVLDDVVIQGDNLSVNEASRIQEGIRIYPNPSKDIVNIVIGSIAEVSYEVYDVSGKLILQDIFSNNDVNDLFQIDLSSFSNGMYFLKMNVNSREWTSKLFKK